MRGRGRFCNRADFRRYFAFLLPPIFSILPSFISFDSTASAVVSLTSGSFASISAFDIGRMLLRTAASTLFDLLTFFPATVANLESRSR